MRSKVNNIKTDNRKGRKYYTVKSFSDISVVTQLQKVAFQIKNNPNFFLSLNEESIMIYSSIDKSFFEIGSDLAYFGNIDYNFEELSEQCIWSICGCDVTIHSIYSETGVILRKCTDSSEIPEISSIKISNNILILNGTKFHSNLWVFLGIIPCKVVRLRSPTCLMAEVLPRLEACTMEFLEQSEKVPILLVREDGLVFRTGFYVYINLL